MKVRFLLDENLSPRLKIAVHQLEPAIDIVRVGDPNTLPLGTLDPELLQYLTLIWETTEAEEWLDRLDWIPF